MNGLNRLVGSPVRNIDIRGRVARVALATALLVGFAGTALSVSGPAVAQEAPVGVAAAAVTPADAGLYLGLSTDFTSDQWTLANELLARSGSDKTAMDLISSAGDDATGSDVASSMDTEAFLGGDAALVYTDLSAATGAASELSGLGGGALDILLPDSAQQAPASGFALLVQPTDMTAAIAAADAEVQSTATSLGVSAANTEYNGVTITAVTGSPDSGETGFAYATVGDFLVLAETPLDIQPFVDVQVGTKLALASTPAFQQADTALGGDRLAFGTLNGVALTAALATMDTTGVDLGATLGGLWGHDAVTGVAIVADDLGLRINTVQIPVTEAAPDAAAPAPADLSFAEKVPSSSAVFANGSNLGEGAVLQGLGLFVVSALNSVLGGDSDETPVAVSEDELYTKTALLLGFNLKTDFVQQMTGEYGFALWFPDPADTSNFSFVLKSGVKDTPTLGGALSKIAFLAQAVGQDSISVSSRHVNGDDVSVISIDSADTGDLTLELGVIDDEFLLSGNGALDTYFGGPGESLADSPDYQAALAALPSDFDTVIYLNIPAISALGSSDLDTGSSGFEDASASCGNYSTQAAAQEAYDADPVTNFDLDSDFDGQACEDYFAAASPVATPVLPVNPETARTFATVIYHKDGLVYSNSILLVDPA